jgi:ATP-dependent Clp protease ATP-binding subunit ClpA
MFEKFDEASNDVIAAAKHECIRLHSPEVLPEHLLLALTRDAENLAAQALASMNINSTNVQQEVERSLSRDNSHGESNVPLFAQYGSLAFSPAVRLILERAADFAKFFGRQLVAPEHILLAMVDLKYDATIRILEELGCNFTFLRRQVLNMVAKQDSLLANAPAAKPTVIDGIAEIIAQHSDGLQSLQRLWERAQARQPKLPDRPELVLTVFLAYLPDFLVIQTAYQRYLLEETLRLLHKRTGPVDKESVATMVSAAAQNLRSDVRSIIDTLWTQEYRLLNHMPDEAEHEEIGSIIEDLWWTYSEEIALHDVFDEALDDYRRKHVLNLQKRKLEISQRLNKLRSRLEETLKQCFTKRSLSA